MATKKSKPAGPANKGLRIVAKRDRFHRAGHAFGPEPTTLSLQDLSDDQVEALKAEPMLVVTEVDIASSAEA